MGGDVFCRFYKMAVTKKHSDDQPSYLSFTSHGGWEGAHQCFCVLDTRTDAFHSHSHDRKVDMETSTLKKTPVFGKTAVFFGFKANLAMLFERNKTTPSLTTIKTHKTRIHNISTNLFLRLLLLVYEQQLLFSATLTSNSP